MKERTSIIIRDANDRFRGGERDIPEERFMTCGLAALIEDSGLALLDVMYTAMRFATFTEDNDPLSIHEFGSFEFEGQTCLWKIYGVVEAL